jgi:hypothetical protein
MIRLILITAFAVAATQAQAQTAAPAKKAPDAAKIEKCKQLARQRGMSFSGRDAAETTRPFVIACAQGKVS